MNHPPYIELEAGINLGNRFSCHPYDTLGIPQEGDLWQTAWGARRITKEYILKIRENGFRTVKLPVTWYPHLSDCDNTISSWFIKQLREVIQWILAEDMYCIISSHHDADWIETECKEDVMYRFRSMWTAISNSFHDFPNTVLYESLNEVGYHPMYPEWTSITNDLNKIFYETVRSNEGGSRTVILEGKWSDIFTTYTEFEMEKIYHNIMIGVHFYEPWQFTIQKEEYDKTFKYDVNSIQDRLNTIPIIEEKYHAPVVITETGCNLYHRDKHDLLNWLRTVYMTCAKNGTPVILWDNGLLGESLMNPDTYTLEYPEALEIIQRYKNSFR